MDDAEPTVPPVAEPQVGPVGRAAPPTSRAVAMFAVVLLVIGLIVAGAWFVGGATTTDCKLDARVGPNGEAFGRDSDQGCQFVDDDGNVLPGQ